MAKETTTAPETEVNTQAPQEQEKEKEKEKETTKAAEKKAAKVYKFTSENKYLTCSGLGVQFIDGKAEVKSLEVAKVLATLDGVKLVEE